MNRGRGLALALVLLLATLAERAAAGDAGGTPTVSTDCEVVRIAYDAAIAGARTCDPAKPDSCGASRPLMLGDVCKCAVPVNPAAVSRLDRLQAEFESKGCVKPGICNRLCRQSAASCSGEPPTCR